MKKLLFILLLLPFASFAQYDSTKNSQPVNGYGFIWKNGRFSGSLIPPTDTVTMAVKDSGAIAYKNRVAYLWTGYIWEAASSGGGGTMPIPNLDSVLAQPGAFTDDRIIQTGAFSLTVDGAGLLLPGLGSGSTSDSFVVWRSSDGKLFQKKITFVQTVTGTLVNNADPQNPVINIPWLQGVSNVDSSTTHKLIADNIISTGIKEFSNNAAAIAGGLQEGEQYRLPYNTDLAAYLVAVVHTASSGLLAESGSALLTESSSPILTE